jgi:hypothetical protein
MIFKLEYMSLVIVTAMVDVLRLWKLHHALVHVSYNYPDRNFDFYHPSRTRDHESSRGPER